MKHVTGNGFLMGLYSILGHGFGQAKPSGFRPVSIPSLGRRPAASRPGEMRGGASLCATAPTSPPPPSHRCKFATRNCNLLSLGSDSCMTSWHFVARQSKEPLVLCCAVLRCHPWNCKQHTISPCLLMLDGGGENLDEWEGSNQLPRCAEEPAQACGGGLGVQGPGAAAGGWTVFEIPPTSSTREPSNQTRASQIGRGLGQL